MFLILAAALAPATAPGQEAVRMSLAGEEAATARRRAAAQPAYYNLKLGPTAWTFGTGLGLEGNDNIRLESSEPKADLIIRPEVDTAVVWPVSDHNNLNLTVAAGYSAYAQYSQFDRFYVRPGSELAFDVYAGDFWLNFHDRFSILEDSYQDPTVVGVGDYAQLDNTAGLGTLWNLNKVVLKLGYDHENYVSVQGSDQNSGQGPDGQAEVVASSAAYALRQGLLVGIEAGASFIHYSSVNGDQAFTDATEWNVGAFSEAQVTGYIKMKVNAGYTVFAPNFDVSAETQQEFSGAYGQLALTHRLNQYVTYTLTGGRSVGFTFFGGTLDRSYAALAAAWKILRKTSLASTFNYEHGSYIVGGPEVFDRYGPGLSLGRTITPKLTASLAYRYYWRESDVPGRDYSVNVATLSLRYRF